MIPGQIFASQSFAGASRTELPQEFTIVKQGVSISCESGSFSASQSIGARSSATFINHSRDGAFLALPGERIEVYSLGRLVFGGRVEEVEETYPGDAASPYKVSSVSASDYSALADRRVVTVATYPEGTLAGAIVRDLAAIYLAPESVSWAGVQDGFAVGPITIAYQTLTEVLDALADLVGFLWRVDFRRVLHFCHPATFSSPWSIETGAETYVSLAVNRGLAEYRNVHTIVAGQDLTAERRRRYSGDSETQVFSVELPIGEEPRIFVDALEQTVGISGVDDESESEFDWFFQLGSEEVSQNSTHEPLGFGQVLEVRFRPLLDLVVKDSDSSEIAARKAVEGGTGIYEAIEEDARINDAPLAVQRLSARLRRLGRIADRVLVTTNRAGLEIGQRFEIDVVQYSGALLLTDVSVVDLGAGNLQWTANGITLEAGLRWPDFWRRLADTGRDLSILSGEGQSVVTDEDSELEVSDSITVGSGNTLSGWSGDYDTFFRVGVPVGSRWTEEGIEYVRAPVARPITHPETK